MTGAMSTDSGAKPAVHHYQSGVSPGQDASCALNSLRQQPVMNLQAKSERRRKDRVEICLDVKWANRNGRLADLSEGGCYIDTLGEVFPGEVVKIAISLPDGRALWLEGVVAHCTPRLGFGVRFINLNDEQRADIRRLLGESSEDTDSISLGPVQLDLLEGQAM
jgi:hypothetical protein